MARPAKIIRLNYYKALPEFHASIGILADPAEVRIMAARDSFIGIREDGLTFSGATPNKINIQGMPDSIRYGGLVKGPRFLRGLIPSTIFTPVSQNRFDPPFKELVKTLVAFSALSTSFLGA